MTKSRRGESVKRESAGKRSFKEVELEVAGGTQSAAERRTAEAELNTLINKFALKHQRLVSIVRRWLQKLLPSAHEVIYEYRDCFVISYSPSERGYEGVLAIRGSADGVKLYFNRGKELQDPQRLLKGSGSMARFIDVESASTLTRPAVAALIDKAIAGNRESFARAGRGALIIRSTSAKKQGQRGEAKAPTGKPRSPVGRKKRERGAA